jgi:hypothetical protein
MAPRIFFTKTNKRAAPEDNRTAEISLLEGKIKIKPNESLQWMADSHR